MVASNTRLSIGPWTEGAVYALPPEDLPGTALAATQNTEVGIGGFLKTRPGLSKHISAALGSTPTLTATGKAVFSSSSSSRFCIAGAVFYEDVSGTWTDRTGAATITAGDDNTWQWVNANGDLYATSTSLADVQIKWAAAAGNIAHATVSGRFTKAKFCAWWDNRLWYAHEDTFEERVWFSNILTPETVGASSFLNVGAPITGLTTLRTGLVVHTDEGLHLIQYDRSLSAYVQQQRGDRGTVSARSTVLNAMGQLFFVRSDGVYQWDIDSPIATEVSATPTKISGVLDGPRYWDIINKTRLPFSFAINNEAKNSIWFVLPHGTAQTDMNHVMVYDYARKIWYGPYLGFTRNCGAYFDHAPYLGGYDDGLLYKHDTGTNDNGVAIDAWFETAALPGVDFGVDVRWLWAATAFGVTGNYNITIQQISARTVTRSEAYNAGGSFDSIGSFIIGISSIAGSTVLRSAETSLQGYSDSMQLRYSNGNLNEEFNVRRVTIPFRPLGIIPHTTSGVS